jgi:hypothetical protein
MRLLELDVAPGQIGLGLAGVGASLRLLLGFVLCI